MIWPWKFEITSIDLFRWYMSQKTKSEKDRAILILFSPSSSSHESKSLHGTGLIDELGVYHLFKNKLTV